MHLAEAKERLRIPELWHRLNLSGEPKASCKSPFREDRQASFSVSADGRLFNDFGTGQGGDALDFLQLAAGLTVKEACKRFIELAGGAAYLPSPAKKALPAAPEARQRPEFPTFDSGSAADFKQLAGLRNLSVEGLQLAGERGLLWFAVLRGFDAWIVTDGERVNAQARRLDGGSWEHLDGAKSWTLRGSWAAWPIGAKESQPYPAIALCEGAGDLLAAFHFIHCEGREGNVAPVALLGASQRIHEDALPLLAGKRVRLYPHTDNAGNDAADRWARQLESVGADADAFDFAGLHQTNGEAVGDLNDCSSICADDFEANPELSGMLP